MTRHNERAASEGIPPALPHRVAILQLGKLGDMILTTPLFTALQQLNPRVRITVIAARESAIIAQHHSAVDEVLEVPRGFWQVPALITRLRANRFDLFIDTKDHHSTTSRLIAEIIRADRSIVHRSNTGRRSGVQELPPPASPGHFVDRVLAPLALLAPGRSFRRTPSVGIPREAYRAVDDQIDQGEYGLVTINISAGHPSRYWRPEKWEETITLLARRYNVAVLSAPADRALADEICTMRKHARPIRTTSILEAAAVVERSLAIISPDTAVIHLASAMQRPCVGLYPPNEENARIFAPLAEPHVVLRPPPDGSIADIAVEDVLRGVREILR